MEEKTLIFIPYQDSDNFFSDGILTREFAVLYMLWSAGYKKIINVKKPRTFLDKKRYKIKEDYYPIGTIENKVKKILENSETIQYQPFINMDQLFCRRAWWETGYLQLISRLANLCPYSLVYSDNPYASKLLAYLSHKGCKIYFDIMDNFAIHPSLNTYEQKMALEGYKDILRFSNYISANSSQTCEYMKPYSPKEICLVKNGVFLENEVGEKISFPQLENVKELKKEYKNCIGYIGKLGLRLDAELIEHVSSACPETLFVFVGSYIKGQDNNRLRRIFEEDNNVAHIDSIPSAYVYTMCNEFDMLSIPHATGRRENGGDPLKLYQYLTRNKPIITTPILGVEEFKEYITISDQPIEWIDFVSKGQHKTKSLHDIEFDWGVRLKPILDAIR